MGAWVLLGCAACSSPGAAIAPDAEGSTSTTAAATSVAQGTDDGTTTGDPARPRPRLQRFVDVTQAAGLASLVPIESRTAPFCLLDRANTEGPGDWCTPERLMGGVAVGDLNGDGQPDLVFPALDGGTRVMIADGVAFTDRSSASGVDPAHRTVGAAIADVDRDGDLDLYLTSFGGTRHLLYVNDGGATFTEQGESRGAAVASAAIHIGTTPAFGDVDLDGDLDLFVGEWRPDREIGHEQHHVALLRNLGPAQPGWFEDVTAAAGIELSALAPAAGVKAGVYAFAPALVDVDGDDFPELAIAGDFGTSRLFRNRGDFTFEDVTVAAGVGAEYNGMGSTLADLDQDGDLDWFVTAIFPDDRPELGNRLYLNDGAGSFVDGTDAWGVRDGGWGWGTVAFDHDHDGDLAIAMTSGWTQMQFDDDPLRLWDRGQGTVLVDVADRLGLGAIGQGRGLVTLDYDGDGDLDLLVTHWGAPPRLYRNDDPPGDWLRVRTVGTTGDLEGRGAKVEVALDDGRRLFRVVGAGSHLYGHDEMVAHFGLGDAAAVRVDVRWPVSGATSEIEAPAANETLVVVEPGG